MVLNRPKIPFLRRSSRTSCTVCSWNLVRSITKHNTAYLSLHKDTTFRLNQLADKESVLGHDKNDRRSHNDHEKHRTRLMINHRMSRAPSHRVIRVRVMAHPVHVHVHCMYTACTYVMYMHMFLPVSITAVIPGDTTVR